MSTHSFCSYNHGLLEPNVTAIWSQDHYRKPHPKFESLIEDIWSTRLKENIHLFDMSKFRLQSYQLDDEKRPSRVTLYLGLTTYKDFIGTNCAPYCKELVKDGISHHGCGKAYLANPLGVGALMETANSEFVLMKRSELCAESPGLIDRPGGHPEPSDIVEEENSNYNFLEPNLFVKEIFHSVLKEIRDEINVNPDRLSQPVLLGVGFNEETCDRPSLEFYVKCTLSSDEVLAKYREQTQPEKEESTDLLFISKQELLKSIRTQDSLSKRFTSSLKSAVFLLNIFSPN